MEAAMDNGRAHDVEDLVDVPGYKGPCRRKASEEKRAVYQQQLALKKAVVSQVARKVVGGMAALTLLFLAWWGGRVERHLSDSELQRREYAATQQLDKNQDHAILELKDMVRRQAERQEASLVELQKINGTLEGLRRDMKRAGIE